MSGDVDSRPANDDTISWLEQSVTGEVLDDSCNIHNTLLPETSLPIDEKEKVHWVHLLNMIRDCNASDKFGVIALHQHKTLLPNHSFVWNLEQVNKSYFYWTSERANERINLDKICGYKFAYNGKGLCPFEFRQGEMLDLSGVDKGLFPRIVQYLVDNHLTSRFGLGSLIPELSKNTMTELQLSRGMSGTGIPEQENMVKGFIAS
ncbi:hypothetical protein Forpi1262_v014560 [Fusarium oxysporum f. sp. raphani]|uniref:Uncharacterized protein n=1 Tax=Fusarium oxysporum f. sp. raphani TaxID=96318 RepID=A0A8J5PJK4_FUSOX|nr:hypothetical protein Forpi1262_v014560 [Fusarium oxysporum f. sp. raphani]